MTFLEKTSNTSVLQLTCNSKYQASGKTCLIPTRSLLYMSYWHWREVPASIPLTNKDLWTITEYHFHVNHSPAIIDSSYTTVILLYFGINAAFPLAFQWVNPISLSQFLTVQLQTLTLPFLSFISFVLYSMISSHVTFSFLYWFLLGLPVCFFLIYNLPILFIYVYKFYT